MKFTTNGWAFPEADVFMMNELKDDGSYQASHLRMGLQYVTDWSIGVDCGAHVGTWSKLMAPVFGRVIAVEPSADTFEALVSNMRQFGCENVELKHVAVGAKPGRTAMVLDGRGLAMQNTGARHVGIGSDVVVETIDSWALPSLGFLKMDIEGSEYAALQGAKETLKRCQPIVLYEAKNLWAVHFGQPKTAVRDFLVSLGYRLMTKASCDEVWAPA